MPNLDQQVPDIMGVGQPFKKLKLQIAQAGTAIPTLAKEFINTLNLNKVTPVFARTSAGLYTMTMAGAFAGTPFFAGCELTGASTGVTARVEKTSANVLTIRTFNAAGAAADYVGDLFLEVEVWYF